MKLQGFLSRIGYSSGHDTSQPSFVSRKKACKQMRQFKLKQNFDNFEYTLSNTFGLCSNCLSYNVIFIRLTGKLSLLTKLML